MRGFLNKVLLILVKSFSSYGMTENNRDYVLRIIYILDCVVQSEYTFLIHFN